MAKCKGEDQGLHVDEIARVRNRGEAGKRHGYDRDLFLFFRQAAPWPNAVTRRKRRNKEINSFGRDRRHGPGLGDPFDVPHFQANLLERLPARAGFRIVAVEPAGGYFQGMSRVSAREKRRGPQLADQQGNTPLWMVIRQDRHRAAVILDFPVDLLAVGEAQSCDHEAAPSCVKGPNAHNGRCSRARDRQPAR